MYRRVNHAHLVTISVPSDFACSAYAFNRLPFSSIEPKDHA